MAQLAALQPAGVPRLAPVLAPSDNYAQENVHLAGIRHIEGQMPFKKPNVDEYMAQHNLNEEEALEQLVNGVHGVGHTTAKCLCASAICLTGVGCLYLCCKQQLVSQGEYGFCNNNSVFEMLRPGRHLLISPLNTFEALEDSGSDKIKVGPLTIVRIRQGSIGLSRNGTNQELLLPGLHFRSERQFDFWKAVPLSEDITYDTIKIFTVKSGQVRVCHNRGEVKIFEEGRYMVNSPSFTVAGTISKQQQNFRLDQHPVLLDGGISVIIEGLLTYRVRDVAQLITQLGDKEVRRAIENITKAELSHVFASVHLEQLSTQANVEGFKASDESKEVSLIGDAANSPQAAAGIAAEGVTRHAICQRVMDLIHPYADLWGLHIINFQLESTKLADEKYAREYEEASLAFAKAKANQRAVAAENEIKIQKAYAAASAIQIESQGKSDALIIEARAAANARKIEADARNAAGKAMRDEFAKEYAMQGLQVDFARSLQAKVLTVLPDSAVGQPFTQGMFPGR